MDEPRIVCCTPKEREAFATLWKDLFVESHAAGHHLVADVATLRDGLGYFDAYTRGSLFGVAFLVKVGDRAVGCYLAGEPHEPSPATSNFGRIAYVWGGCVLPEWRKRGIAATTMKYGETFLRQIGFDTVTVGVPQGNEASHQLTKAIGMEPYEVLYFKRLKEPASG